MRYTLNPTRSLKGEETDEWTLDSVRAVNCKPLSTVRCLGKCRKTPPNKDSVVEICSEPCVQYELAAHQWTCMHRNGCSSVR
jgi:hypothetical protein